MSFRFGFRRIHDALAPLEFPSLLEHGCDKKGIIKQILDGYRLKRPVCALTNGVDTAFFAPDAGRRAAFRRAYGLADSDPVVICAGHYFVRKGVLDFIELARAMPEVKFFWFGYTDPALTPAAVRRAIAEAPANLRFPGYVSQAELRDAYCGADVFAFCSHEETEGIVVLEALACGIPVVVRDIPVYQGWLTDGKQVLKRRDTAGFRAAVGDILGGAWPRLGAEGRAAAEARSIAAAGQQLCALYRQYARRKAG